MIVIFNSVSSIAQLHIEDAQQGTYRRQMKNITLLCSYGGREFEYEDYTFGR
jgi:hypothetical protein